MKKYFWLVVGIIIGVLLMTGLGLFTHPYTMRGSTINPPSLAPEISLSNVNGQRFVLSDHKNRLVLIFFGFTNCRDICPVTLAEMKELRSRLGEKASRVDVVFITVDPQRDTADRMKTYIDSFDPQIIGLTAKEQELQPVWDAYGVYREIQKENSSSSDYEVSHSSRIYLIDRHGCLRLTYPFGTPVDDIEQDVRYLLKEN